MTTNNQIKQALFSLLQSANLGHPIAWPGCNFEPPGSGEWLEVSFFPNEGIDNGLSYSDGVTPQGIFQVECVTRPGRGTVKLGAVADQVRGAFLKGQTITGMVRVIRTPYDMELDPRDDRMSIVVTIEYSG